MTHHHDPAGSVTGIPENHNMVSYPHDAFQVLFLHDGTSTVAELLAKTAYGTQPVIARGLSRRRKGDKRDVRLGEVLALARMFQAAADYYSERARAGGVEPFSRPLILEKEERKPVEHVQAFAGVADAHGKANGT